MAKSDYICCEKCDRKLVYVDDDNIIQVDGWRVFCINCYNETTSQLAAAKAENQRQRRALVVAAVPLEAIHISVKWELTDELKAAVAEAVEAIRKALEGRWDD
jgi:Ni,Fe-hydrogenase maturation factor